MESRAEKRQRTATTDLSASCWNDAVEWIRSNGGTVHSALTFSSTSTNRSVQIAEHTNETAEEDSIIPAGTVLMRIPSSCLLTTDAVSFTSYGKKLVGVIQSASSSSDNSLHNDPSDLILALYMAHMASDADDSASGHAAYLATLPPPSSYDSIPRRWDDKQLESLLGGTSLLTHVRKEQAALKSDYAVISTAWSKANSAGDISSSKFPVYDKFDDMFAAVSSRGFAGLGSFGHSDAMVPLLDLLDHRRGTDAKKDVWYKRSSDADDKGEDNAATAYVEVVADRDLSPGTAIHDTYGAKGNAQLLSRYGFCIPNNLEPDGSSNDVVELSLKEGGPMVELRAGPKSYTYGKLARMVEMFQEADGNEKANCEEGETSGADDMEAFLNQCDEEEEGDNGDDDDFDMMMYGEIDGEDGEDEGDEEKLLESECKALEQLSEALTKARERYSLKGKEMQDALEKTDGSRSHFAAILVQSERRTIRLYQLAAKKILPWLKSMMTGSPQAAKGGKATEDNADDPDGLLSKQVDELVSAYATIRHGGLM